MTTVSKRIILASVGALLVVLVLIWLIPSRDAGYRAVSVVRANTKNRTNTISTRTLETQVMHAAPGVLKVAISSIVTTYVSNPGPGDSAVTNAMDIFIMAGGPTAEEAQRVANEAAATVCATILTNYGVTGEIFQKAKARPYSFLKDKVRPIGTRLYQSIHH